MSKRPLPPFPSDDAISAALGFHAPSDFVDVLQAAYAESDGSWDAFIDYLAAIGWSFEGTFLRAFSDMDAIGELRYSNDPPEFVPIATMHVDGARWGLVVHTPEVSIDQLPVAHYCPMDSEPAYLVGGNVAAAIWNCLVESDVDNTTSERLARGLSRRMRSDPLRELVPRERASPVLPAVPEGYKFVMSSDWIGVCAPLALFADPMVPPAHWERARPCVRALLDGGKPASALLLAREFAWQFCYARPEVTECAHLMQIAYRDLGRPLHAENLAAQLRNG